MSTTLRSAVITALISIVSISLSAQSSIWTDVEESTFTQRGVRHIVPTEYRVIKADFDQLSQRAKKFWLIFQCQMEKTGLSKSLSRQLCTKTIATDFVISEHMLV